MTHQDRANFLALAGEVVRVDFAQLRHGAGAGAFHGGVPAAGDRAQGLVGGAPGLLGGHPPVAADDKAAVGGLASTPARAVLDDVGAHPGGPHADAEAGQPVVPCDVGLMGGDKGFDAAYIQGFAARLPRMC